MSSLTSGSLTTTGSVTLSKKPTETLTEVVISGTYGTVTLVLEASKDSTNFFAVNAISVSDGSLVSGTLSPSDNTCYCWKVPSEGYTSVRARVTAIASGTVAFVLDSSSYVSPPFIASSTTGPSLNTSLTLADATNLIVGSSTGTKIGTATTQKLGFYNATPIVQVANTVDYLAGLVNLGLRGSGGTADAAFPGGITSSKATGTGIGYTTGAGGAVTQATNRSTGVTLSKLTGTITTDTTSLAAGAEAKFTVTNTTVAATDTIIVSLASGNTGIGTCLPYVSAVGSGSFDITISNLHASTAETGACVLNFTVIKGVAA